MYCTGETVSLPANADWSSFGMIPREVSKGRDCLLNAIPSPVGSFSPFLIPLSPRVISRLEGRHFEESTQSIQKSRNFEEGMGCLKTAPKLL